jgi:hypothetical protein
MNKNRNLQNGIGIQMGQIQAIEIKEAAEERRNGQSKSTDKKRNVNDGFVVSSVGTVTPRQIRHEQSSFGGRTPMEMR